MNKLEFICRQCSRATPKIFEHYVVTRIWHLLNDPEVKFITQQYVIRPNGGRALTDMFFPQLKKYVEINERHHENQIDPDKIRKADIINAIGFEELKIDVTINGKTIDIEKLNERINNIVDILRNAKAEQEDFKPWDFEAGQESKTYIQRGYIDLKDDVAFKTMVDAAKCFGHTYKPKGIWTGGVKHPKEDGKVIWFPKLYENEQWKNEISDDENTIIEKCKDPENNEKHVTKAIKENAIKRIVFARVKSPLGDIMYRFKGEYELDLSKTNTTNGMVLKRINERVKTYTS